MYCNIFLLGFLSTQDSVIPGNNGLKDQQFAIKWVHDNIKLFGGDPNRIIIFGQSAGAASVAYQLLNKNSEGTCCNIGNHMLLNLNLELSIR